MVCTRAKWNAGLTRLEEEGWIALLEVTLIKPWHLLVCMKTRTWPGRIEQPRTDQAATSTIN